MGLGKLVAFWDDNGISIDGHVEGWFTDNTPQRFEAYGWHVIADVDGHDPEAIKAAIAAAKAETTKPTLICCKTIIGLVLRISLAAMIAMVHRLVMQKSRRLVSSCWPYAPF